MDIGTALSVAQTLFAALECTQLRDVFFILGYKDELDNLAKTVETIKAVLLDAESKGDGLTHQAQCYVDDLKYAIFEADDLLDEFVTLAERKHHKFPHGAAANKALAKARALFSRFKELGSAYSMSKEVKSIRKKLDAIADNHNKFGFKLDSQPIRRRKEETCSYVYDKDIIGRDAEREEIVNRLLQSNGERDVSFLTIVGIGGLGKTSLAQLVFNDDKIKASFPTRYWACVGDEDAKHMNVKAVLAQIVGHKQDQFTLESLQRKFKEKITNKKYLIVLDDVWIENQLEWRKLEVFLRGGAHGSWVLVTTRLRTTASIIGDGSLYDLKGLSDENSWRLFEMVAFGQVGGVANPPDLVEIGQKVVEKCANVPLAIRVAGSLLYGQPMAKWVSFKKSGFGGFDTEKNGILPILKFSYYHLESPLKCCFSYCALFPKDYNFKKEMLIRMWEAQGYIVPTRGETKEDIAQEYFSILLRRCFFQDVGRNKYDGEIVSFKIHDLLHDVAKQVAGKEISVEDHLTSEFDKRIVHLTVVKSMSIEGVSSRKIVRTLLFDPLCKHKFDVGTLLKNWMSLRALALRNLELEKIPDVIGKLLHLRLIDFSNNSHLVKLPKSFTKLHNLETLLLTKCKGLRELPNDINKLVKLSCLDIMGCSEQLHIPESIGKLSSLRMLPYFVVNMSNSLQCTEGLKGLRALDQLKRRLQVEIYDCEGATNAKEEIGEGAVLINKQHLNQIVLDFHEDSRQDYQEALMERLQPHRNLKILQILKYRGNRMPSWAGEHKLGSSLSNLVIMMLSDCDGLKHLSGMGKLPHLRRLELEGLSSLEYVEECRNGSQLKEEYDLFFPSLKILILEELPKLKGWWRVEADDVDSQPPQSFPHLFELSIKYCEELTLIPAFPSVENLILREVNERLRISVGGVNHEKEGKTPTCTTQCRIETNYVGVVKSVMSMKALRCLTTLEIAYDEVVNSLEQEVEAWWICSSSLRSLTIEQCSELRCVYEGGLEHLSALEELTIRFCDNVKLSDEDDEDEDEDDRSSLSNSLCPPFSHALRSMRLEGLPSLVKLPGWMRYLNNLHSLYIGKCASLESLPEWMQHLTSLTLLEISGCSEELVQRCSPNPPGQYWPYISHIPNLHVSTC